VRFRNLFLVCSDLGRSEVFYRALGLALVRRGERSLVFDLGGSELHLHPPLTPEEEQLFQVGPAGPAPGCVICLHTSDLEARAQFLPAECVRIPPGPAPWGGRMMLVADPDGRLLELSE